MGFSFFAATGVGCETIWVDCGICSVPFSDATMFAMVREAAAAAARLEVGALAATAAARVEGSSSGNPIAGVR